MINCNPHYVNERQSDLRAVKEGWYAMDEHGKLLFGPFFNRESCLTRISQTLNWTTSLESRQPDKIERNVRFQG
jgi:hypothetical protein